jgi:uncharacterized phiE125 gp8 family phage protein
MGIKVITPPTLTSIISDANLRVHLKLAADGSEDELMTTYRAAAHALAEHYTGYAIGSQVLELALDEFPNEAIELPRGKVTAIGSLKYMDTDEVEQTISASEYTLDDYSTPCWLVPAVDYVWPTPLEGANVVKVRYTVGDVPEAVKGAILQMCAWQHEHRGDGKAADDIQPPAAKQMLNTVKVHGF